MTSCYIFFKYAVNRLTKYVPICINFYIKFGSDFVVILELKVFAEGKFGFLFLSLHKPENTVNRQKTLFTMF